jgi:hypothetical protein
MSGVTILEELRLHHADPRRHLVGKALAGAMTLNKKISAVGIDAALRR